MRKKEKIRKIPCALNVTLTRSPMHARDSFFCLSKVPQTITCARCTNLVPMDLQLVAEEKANLLEVSWTTTIEQVVWTELGVPCESCVLVHALTCCYAAILSRIVANCR